MAQVIRSKNRKGRSAQIVIWDLQGSVLPQEFIEKMETEIEKFLDSDPFGKSVAITVNVE